MPLAETLAYNEILSVHIETKPTIDETGVVYVIAVRTTVEGTRVVRAAAGSLRQIIVFHDGEPIGLGGTLPFGSLYPFGEFHSFAEAENTVRRLGFAVDRGSPSTGDLAE